MRSKGIGAVALVLIGAVIVGGSLAGYYMLKGGDFGSMLGKESGTSEG